MILDQLKSIDITQVDSETLKKGITTALSYYDDKDNLTPEEVAAYEKLYNKVQDYLDKKQKAKLEDDKKKQAIEAEKKLKDDVSKKQTANKKRIEDTAWPHVVFMQQESIELSSLPQKTRDSIKLFKASSAMFIKKGTDQLFSGLMKKSENIKKSISDLLQEEEKQQAAQKAMPQSIPAAQITKSEKEESSIWDIW